MPDESRQIIIIAIALTQQSALSSLFLQLSSALPPTAKLSIAQP
jgi:hypothetical protein